MPTPVLVGAVERAWQAGCLIVAAAGNVNYVTDGSPPRPGPPHVLFPAGHPRVIAAGASDLDDRRKSLASSDGEQWESCYLPPPQGGTGVDVVAPGVLTWTTNDRSGHPMKGDDKGPNHTPGYEWFGVVYPRAGDPTDEYLRVFGGTSAATPLVSGLAALIMARDPALTNAQVRAVIESTCRKVNAGMGPGKYAYTSPGANGWRAQEVGYGRIDCDAALRLLPSPPAAGGPPVPRPDREVIPWSGSAPGAACGFLGRSEVPGLWRLYLGATLDAYLEIEEEGILHVADAPGSLGTRVLFRRDAVRRHVRAPGAGGARG